MEIDDELPRSRRNLIILSLLIIIYYVADISINKVSFWAGDVNVGNVLGLKIMVLLALSYLALRYRQHLAQKPLGIESAFLQKFNFHYSRRLYKKLIITDAGDFPEYRWSGKGFLWYYSYPRHLNEFGELDEYEHYAKLRLLIIPFFHSLYFVVINTEKFTEYIAPYIFACIAFILMLVKL
jgi:hypothetical protein